LADSRSGTRPGAGRKRGRVGEVRRALAEMAKEHAEPALRTLVEIAAGDGAASARVSAATAILDRAYGRPPQALEHSANGHVQIIVATGIHRSEDHADP
jgi:hypothetical protein